MHDSNDLTPAQLQATLDIYVAVPVPDNLGDFAIETSYKGTVSFETEYNEVIDHYLCDGHVNPFMQAGSDLTQKMLRYLSSAKIAFGLNKLQRESLTAHLREENRSSPTLPSSELQCSRPKVSESDQGYRLHKD